jgi:hypothetical protein
MYFKKLTILAINLFGAQFRREGVLWAESGDCR